MIFSLLLYEVFKWFIIQFLHIINDHKILLLSKYSLLLLSSKLMLFFSFSRMISSITWCISSSTQLLSKENLYFRGIRCAHISMSKIPLKALNNVQQQTTIKKRSVKVEPHSKAPRHKRSLVFSKSNCQLRIRNMKFQ